MGWANKPQQWSGPDPRCTLVSVCIPPPRRTVGSERLKLWSMVCCCLFDRLFCKVFHETICFLGCWDLKSKPHHTPSVQAPQFIQFKSAASTRIKYFCRNVNTQQSSASAKNKIFINLFGSRKSRPYLRLLHTTLPSSIARALRPRYSRD